MDGIDSQRPSFLKKWILGLGAILIVLVVGGGSLAYFVFGSAHDSSLVLKSFALSDAGQGTQAEVIAQQAITANPKDSEAYRALGYAQEIQQNYSAAHLSYQKAIALKGHSALAYYDDAQTFFLEGNLTQAEVEYHLAIKFDSNLSVAHGGLARLLLDNKNPDAALTEYKTAYSTAKNPREKADAAYQIGQILLFKKEFAQAGSYAIGATTLDPTYAPGWYGLGMFIQTQSLLSATATIPVAGSISHASPPKQPFEYFNKALSLDPNFSLAYLQKAIVYNLLGQPKTAVQILSYASTALPNDSTLSAGEKAQIRSRITKLQESISASIPKKK